MRAAMAAVLLATGVAFIAIASIGVARLPDVFQDHDSPDKQYDEARLNAPHIVATVLSALRHNSAGVEEARA